VSWLLIFSSRVFFLSSLTFHVWSTHHYFFADKWRCPTYGISVQRRNSWGVSFNSNAVRTTTHFIQGHTQLFGSEQYFS
jgi:hypothetical protein